MAPRPSLKHYTRVGSGSSLDRSSAAVKSCLEQEIVKENYAQLGLPAHVTSMHLAEKCGSLATQATVLSSDLLATQMQCGHQGTKDDIGEVATELPLLATTIFRVQEAMTLQPNLYTRAFHQDLAEIVDELGMCFEEIAECCKQMGSTDDAASRVPWFFNKDRVAKLARHLRAVKATLVIMRNVLWNGVDSAKGNTTHVMNTERLMIESTFKRDKDAILDLKALADTEAQGLHAEEPECADDEGPRASHKFDVSPRPSNVARRFTQRVGPTMIQDRAVEGQVSELEKKWLDKKHLSPKSTRATAAPEIFGITRTADSDNDFRQHTPGASEIDVLSNASYFSETPTELSVRPHRRAGSRIGQKIRTVWGKLSKFSLGRSKKQTQEQTAPNEKTSDPQYERQSSQVAAPSTTQARDVEAAPKFPVPADSRFNRFLNRMLDGGTGRTTTSSGTYIDTEGMQSGV